MADYPCIGVKYKGKVRDHKNASIQRRNPLKEKYFIAETNKHRLYYYSALACATRPWRTHFSTTRSLSLWTPLPSTWSSRCSPPLKELTEKAIRGPLVLDANSPQATSWPKETVHSGKTHHLLR